jgi:hypothetical protein
MSSCRRRPPLLVFASQGAFAHGADAEQTPDAAHRLAAIRCVSMSTPQNGPRRRKQKARRAKRLARWRERRIPIDEAALAGLFDDTGDREARTIRHEAGHAAAAWLVQGNLDVPPFTYIEIGTMQKHAGGVVPGGVAIDPDWFATLSPKQKSAILLAGVYAQDYEGPYTADSWRQLLDGLEGANGTDDYLKVREVADDNGIHRHRLDQEGLDLLSAAEPDLGLFVKLIGAELQVGQQTGAAVFVAKVKAMVSKAQEELSYAAPASSSRLR